MRSCRECDARGPDLRRYCFVMLQRIVRKVELALSASSHCLYAAAAARRGAGFSTIGRLISAESTPSRIESHHTTS
jgi:hypothetical protein